MSDDDQSVAAHDQTISHKYRVRFPAHAPREGDPHYHLFNEVKKRYKPTAKCWYAEKIGTDAHCRGGLELHHWILEDAIINEVDPVLLDKDYPDAPHDPDQIDVWVQSHYKDDGSGTLVFLCVNHHRGQAGAHTVDFANWKGSWYAPDLLAPADDLAPRATDDAR